MLEGNDAEALTFRMDINHIYSMSYGYVAKESRIFPLHAEVARALAMGAREGRGGLGSIYVSAAGNDAVRSNCAFNGYCNDIHTITVGAISKRDRYSAYSEACTAVMISSYSGAGEKDGLFTISSYGDKCYGQMSGTSAATPLVSGVLALVLQAR